MKNSDAHYSKKALKLACAIKRKLKIPSDVSSISDINVDFLEEIYRKLTSHYVSSNKSLSDRLEAIINWLSDCLNIPLDHICSHSILNNDPLNLHNLLELLDLCIDVHDDVLESRPLELISDGIETDSVSSSISKENIDANLEKSRLKYLQCKLAELLAEECPVENLPKPIELCFTGPETHTVPRVKFAEQHEIIPCSMSTSSHRPAGSLLLPITRPLSRGTNENSVHVLKFFNDIDRHIRRSSCTPYANSSKSEAGTIFNELIGQLSVLELSREIQNYIKIRLQSHMKGGKPSKGTWNSAKCRLMEMSERQQKLAELAERSEEECSRIRALRNSRAVENLVNAELRQKKRQVVSDRHLNIRLEEQLRAYEKAKKIEEERTVRRAFDAALEKARKDRIEEKNLMREFRQKQNELQNALISNLENRYEQHVRLLKDEKEKRQKEAELIAKSNNMENLQEKMTLRKQLTQQIKELEEALLNQIRA